MNTLSDDVHNHHIPLNVNCVGVHSLHNTICTAEEGPGLYQLFAS